MSKRYVRAGKVGRLACGHAYRPVKVCREGCVPLDEPEGAAAAVAELAELRRRCEAQARQLDIEGAKNIRRRERLAALDARIALLTALLREAGNHPNPAPDLWDRIAEALNPDRPPAIDLLGACPGSGLDNSGGEAASMQGRQGATGGKDTCAGDEP